MKATIGFIKERFDKFNALIFGGTLPNVPLEINSTRSSLGQCITDNHIGRDAPAKRFKIRITCAVDMSESMLEDVLIHEMIHLFIGVNGLKDTSPHGEIFQGMMRAVNAVHGRAIAVSSRGGTTSEAAPAAQPTKAVRVIAVVELTDGRTGIKVLPRTHNGIVRFKTAMMASRNVRSVTFYVHDNPWFARFPKSSVARVHILDAAEIAARLKGAEKISGQ